MRVLASALSFLLAATVAANAATVRGTVTASTGGPLPGMIVAAYDPAGVLRASANSDNTGFYVLTVTSGEYRLLAYDPAGVFATTFDGNAESFETAPLRTVPSGVLEIAFALVKGGAVTGTVKTAGGLAQGAAMIEAYNLSGTRRGFTTADLQGAYSLVLPPGQYKLVAYDPADVFALSFHPGQRAFADATPVAVALNTPASIHFILGTAGRVFGTAVDAATAQPLPSILVYAYTPAGSVVASTATDAAGSFRFSLPAGAYRFVAAQPAGVYATAYYEGSRSFERARVVDLAAGQQRSGVQIAMPRGVRASGHVHGPDFVVAAYNLDGTLHVTGTSEATGHYSLLLAPGDCRIAVSDPSLTHATLFYGGTTDFRFARVVSVIADITALDVTLPRAGRVNGTVRANGVGLAGMTVAAYDSSDRPAATATTKPGGTYAMAVAPGVYRVLAFDSRLDYITSYRGDAPSYESTAPIEIVVDTAVTVDFNTRIGVEASGSVRTEDGTPLSGMEIFALDASGDRVAGGESANGLFTIVLAPGTYGFIAVDPFGRFARTLRSGDVVIVDGQSPSPIALIMKPATRRRSARH